MAILTTRYEEATRSVRLDCTNSRVVERLWAKDTTLWPTYGAEDIQDRLGWLDIQANTRSLLDAIDVYVNQVRARGLDRVVLCGMGGSSLAPEVICHNADVDLLVVDSSHPEMVNAAIAELERTIVVVSSKSGTTLETESHLRQFVAAFEAKSLDLTEHLVIVTDPGSALANFAAEHDVPVFFGNPDVGGRYSALTAFGLVPSALAGANVRELVSQANSLGSQLREASPDNPALELASAIAHVSRSQLGILGLHGDKHQGLGGWIEQLIAESLGKHRKGALPVVDPQREAFLPSGALTVDLGSIDRARPRADVVIDEPLGAQFLLWECATAIAGHLLNVDPFDQPDVESSKAAARQVLAHFGPPKKPDFVDGNIRGWGVSATSFEEAVMKFKHLVEANGYLSLCCFLDRWQLQSFESVAHDTSHRLERAVTFGWGPRYLHSTGQLHKGGPLVGAFIHVSAPNSRDFEVAGQPFTWGEMLSSQVRGDAKVLRELGLPVLRLEFDELETGLARLKNALLA